MIPKSNLNLAPHMETSQSCDQLSCTNNIPLSNSDSESSEIQDRDPVVLKSESAIHPKQYQRVVQQSCFVIAQLPTPPNHPTPILVVEPSPGHQATNQSPRSGPPSRWQHTAFPSPHSHWQQSSNYSPGSTRWHTSNRSPRTPRDLPKNVSDCVFAPLQPIEKDYIRGAMYIANTSIAIDERGNPPPPSELDDGIKLFPQVATEHIQYRAHNPKKVAVVVPIYNEEAIELWHSLRDLSAQQEELGSERQLDICIIQDGWSRASQSMKDYLVALFPPADPMAMEPVSISDTSSSAPIAVRNWRVPLEAGGVRYDLLVAGTHTVDEKLPLTVVVARYSADQQSRHLVSVFHPEDQNKRPAGELLLTLIVKKDNRRKHNSHIWFLSSNGFAPSTGAQLSFLTDGGTMFEKGCLRALIRYMELHPSCAVVTGRQRVMTAKQQTIPESLISWMSLYRAAIMFDYEAGFASFVGAFALFGFLPVVPGPCGLYRDEMLRGAPLDNYFEILQQSPQQTGLVLGNLRLAEDRVLSYAPMIWGNSMGDKVYMGVEPTATFLFQQEEGLENLVAQRRRWINGTVAGYLWLLANFGLIFNSARMAWYTKFFTLLLALFQMILYIEVAISPMIFLLPLRHLFVDYLSIRTSDPSLPTGYFVEILWWICVALWLAFVLRHAGWSKYDAWMFLVLGILGTVALFTGIVSLTVFMGTYNWQVIDVNATNVTTAFNTTVLVVESNINESELILLIGIGFLVIVFILPFINAFLYSPKSLLLMLLTLIPFWLFLPTLVVWFGTYAFCRFWDLNWGNRPSDQMDEIGNVAIREATQRALKQESYSITGFIVLLNFLYALLYELNSARPIVITATIIMLFMSTFVQLVFSFIFAICFNFRRCYQLLCCPSPREDFDLSTSSASSSSSKSPNEDCHDV